jgi:hypothetical protein
MMIGTEDYVSNIVLVSRESRCKGNKSANTENRTHTKSNWKARERAPARFRRDGDDKFVGTAHRRGEQDGNKFVCATRGGGEYSVSDGGEQGEGSGDEGEEPEERAEYDETVDVPGWIVDESAAVPFELVCPCALFLTSILVRFI